MSSHTYLISKNESFSDRKIIGRADELYYDHILAHGVQVIIVCSGAITFEHKDKLAIPKASNLRGRPVETKTTTTSDPRVDVA